MALKDWRKINEWKINKTWAVRYWNGKKAKTLQISKYRKADDYDKSVGDRHKWHGKWYVNVWHPEKTYLFDTKTKAITFAKNYMRKH